MEEENIIMFKNASGWVAWPLLSRQGHSQSRWTAQVWVEKSQDQVDVTQVRPRQWNLEVLHVVWNFKVDRKNDEKSGLKWCCHQKRNLSQA